MRRLEATETTAGPGTHKTGIATQADTSTEAGTVTEPDIVTEADALVAGLAAQPWGQVSSSLYETARLVSLAPWLLGHGERLGHLLAAQRADGGWGGPDGYGLVPTLSATEALLSVLRHGAGGADRRVLGKAAEKGLWVLSGWLDGTSSPTPPDMPAIELIMASLIESINLHLDALTSPTATGPAAAPTGLCAWPTAARLPNHPGWDAAWLKPVRAVLATGQNVPEKMIHALEIAGPMAHRFRAAQPGPLTGVIGASPAATAAWLGPNEPSAADPSRRFLEAVVERYGPAVPCGVPVTAFERSWVLSVLHRAGIKVSVSNDMLTGLSSMFGPNGTPAGEGLPADADTTSVVVHTLAALGVPRSPDILLNYELDTHFCTWPGEQGSSVSTNAHVLDAFSQYVACRPETAPRYAAAMAKTRAWLRGQQRDGSWTDRWHVSPYYATSCAVLALTGSGAQNGREGSGNREDAHHVRTAVHWTLAGQQTDGSWGVWGATAEETAYALQILLATPPAPEDAVAVTNAVARGRAWLLHALDLSEHPALWHDKDLYLPSAIVRANVLAALRLTHNQIVRS
ncbi:hypothetical protein [Actinomadura sp. 6N118]|uniref:hypothetical protein n=1 Tax=Actinomadura sp. 6N118 TaxID=3375151 RepID=UPI0037B7B772